MCLIIDANVAKHTFSTPPKPDFEPIHKALIKGQASIVYGGKLTDEYSRVSSILDVLLALDRAGRAKQFARDALEAVEATLLALGTCKSNDIHIIALAQVSGARLLCSHDKALHQDFTNKMLLSDPRGNVYQTPKHTHLLRKGCST